MSIFFIDKRREIRTMTKMEMVNRMIVLGCIKESDRNNVMRWTKEHIMKTYIYIVPVRLEHLAQTRVNHNG